MTDSELAELEDRISKRLQYRLTLMGAAALVALLAALTPLLNGKDGTNGTDGKDADPKEIAEILKDDDDFIAAFNVSSESGTPDDRLPVGTVIASLLNPDTFSREYGAAWILADGRTVSATSRYSEITGVSQVPDLRGVFLRGINHGRTDQLGDLAGDRKPGHYQPDGIAAHQHDFKEFHANIRAGIHSGNQRENPGHNYEKERVTDPNRGFAPETRPRNVAVYHYLKIN